MPDSMYRLMKEEEERRRQLQQLTGTFTDHQTLSAVRNAYETIQQQELASVRLAKASALGELSTTLRHHKEMSAIYDAVRANEMTAAYQAAIQASQLASANSATDSYDWKQVSRMAGNAVLHDLAAANLATKIIGQDVGYTKVLQELEQQKRFEAAFRLPLATEFLSLTAGSAAANSLASASFGTRYADELQDRMKEMREPWLSASMPSASVGAFADLQAIGHLAKQNDPFAATVSTALRTALGDWREPINFDSTAYLDPILRSRRYLDLGLNPELTDFTVPAFEQSLEIAGLGWPKPAVVSETNDSSEEEGLNRNSRAHNQIQRLEIQLRKFIESKMFAKFGDEWMVRQLPNGMLERLREKKETAIKAGEPNGPLMDYADFTDYRGIIERKDNWEKVFKSLFGRKEDICESFQRLFPVRIATMHARIITQDDELLLQVESTRILRVISK